MVFAILFASADYNLSLNRIEYVILPQLKTLNELIQKRGTYAAFEAVQYTKSEYANYDISSQGFISDITTEEQKIERRIMKKELEEQDIQWLSEKLEPINREFSNRNREFSNRTGIRLAHENVEEKMKAEDAVNPDGMMDIDDVDNIIAEDRTSEESE